ncbi:MAG TPA: 30S ribosomal protein S14 [Pirellulaceae bacterium]|jgi:small subunit ribosomal protein S14|nr:30S ribosomal protein S14 [Pirellulaceae bacterium]
MPKSTAEKMKKIDKLVKKYAAKRELLKQEGRFLELSLLPRNSSPTRYRNLCKLTGRSRSYYRKFGLSRHMLRKLANEGLIPGLKAASW